MTFPLHFPSDFFFTAENVCTHKGVGTYIAGEFMDQVKMPEADNACKIHLDSPLDQQSQSRPPATEADCRSKDKS